MPSHDKRMNIRRGIFKGVSYYFDTRITSHNGKKRKITVVDIQNSPDSKNKESISAFIFVHAFVVRASRYRPGLLAVSKARRTKKCHRFFLEIDKKLPVFIYGIYVFSMHWSFSSLFLRDMY